MLALRDADPSGAHAFLLLSFELAGYTTVLDVRGTSFCAASPEGLDLNCPTLLAAKTSAGHLLQVTPQVSPHPPEIISQHLEMEKAPLAVHALSHTCTQFQHSSALCLGAQISLLMACSPSQHAERPNAPPFSAVIHERKSVASFCH